MSWCWCCDPQAVTPGVTHVGAYHRPSDGYTLHFLQLFRRGKASCGYIHQQIMRILFVRLRQFGTIPVWFESGSINVNNHHEGRYQRHIQDCDDYGETHLRSETLRPGGIFRTTSSSPLNLAQVMIIKRTFWANPTNLPRMGISLSV